jgi:hypothetical protein
MKTNSNEAIGDLKLLIDISCMDLTKMSVFENFHKKIIALTYQATDIEIDYARKRIYLNVIGEEKSGDYLEKFDDYSVYRMATNLSYTNFSDFLKVCITDDSGVSKNFPALKYEFFKGHSKNPKSVQTFEKA